MHNHRAFFISTEILHFYNPVAFDNVFTRYQLKDVNAFNEVAQINLKNSVSIASLVLINDDFAGHVIHPESIFRSFKLKDIGVKMYKQQISKIFANPFYCGIVAHGLLDGQVREGLHEKMISKEVFFKINEVRMNNSRLGVPHKRENDDLPLRVFCKCSVCGESLTGYVVKKKNLYYYKCSKKGCNLNKSAKQMHELFVGLLKRYIVKEELVEPIAYQIEHEYNALK